jgi:arylsulfatase A-like enzyme
MRSILTHWPGLTKPGATTGTPAVHVDVYPTLLEIVGARPPADYVLDGVTLVAVARPWLPPLPYSEQHGPGLQSVNRTPANELKP